MAFFPKRGLSFPGHSRRRKNENGRAGGLKNFQSAVDSAFVGNDHAQWRWSLLPLDSRLLQLSREAEPHVVALQTRVPDQDRIGQGALAKQVQLVFARGEIDRRKIPGRNFTIHRHREGGRDKGPRNGERRLCSFFMGFRLSCGGEPLASQPNVIIGMLTAIYRRKFHVIPFR